MTRPMTEMFDHIRDYLTWHPDVLAYSGLTILSVGVLTCVYFLINL